MKEYKFAVYIGRFQPFHNGHLEVIKNGLELADQVIVVIGSAGAAPNIKNPWSFEERKQMIYASLEGNGTFPWGRYSNPNVHIVGVRDYYYNENTWLAEVQTKTGQYVQDGDSVALLGAYKDHSSYYISHFPQWDFHPTALKRDDLCTGTDIRDTLFHTEKPIMTDWEGKVPTPDKALKIIKGLIPDPVLEQIENWAEAPLFADLLKEYKFIKDYKASWKSAPFPPTFVCTDAIVVCSGHVLVIKRKFNPGKGLYALPGGFLKQSERLQASALRELKEETGIRVDKLILESSIVSSKVFDHPDRSLRGRTITHGFYIKLKDGKLPEVKANDDASEVLWMPLMDVSKSERKFFDDHFHIIYNTINS